MTHRKLLSTAQGQSKYSLWDCGGSRPRILPQTESGAHMWEHYMGKGCPHSITTKDGSQQRNGQNEAFLGGGGKLTELNFDVGQTKYNFNLRRQGRGVC